MEREITCCFTGHRPDKLPWGTDERDPRCLALKKSIARELEGLYLRGYRHFISGMARGADLYFVEAALALREKYPSLTVEGAVPCQSQADRWRGGARRWTPAIWKPWSSTTMTVSVCTAGTAIWWTVPPSSWPPLTAPPAARCTPSAMPWTRGWTSCCWI